MFTLGGVVVCGTGSAVVAGNGVPTFTMPVGSGDVVVPVGKRMAMLFFFVFAGMVVSFVGALGLGASRGFFSGLFSVDLVS
jgi:hypothetical protein